MKTTLVVCPPNAIIQVTEKQKALCTACDMERLYPSFTVRRVMLDYAPEDCRDCKHNLACLSGRLVDHRRCTDCNGVILWSAPKAPATLMRVVCPADAIVRPQTPRDGYRCALCALRQRDREIRNRRPNPPTTSYMSRFRRRTRQ